jgi:ABC-type lipoprotein release transport system permease subunit
MAALWRVAARDLRGRRLPTALFFGVVAVAATGITAGLAQQRSAAERWDDAFRRANGAHVALYGDRPALRRVEADRQVVRAAGPSPVTFATLVRGRDRVDDVEVRAAGARRQAVGTPLLFGGRWLSAGAPGEVVVERSFALAEGVGPGDRIRLRGADGALTLRVVGAALNLVDCFYPECESQTAWTSAAAVNRLAARRHQESLLLARIAHPDAVGTFTARAERTAGTGIRDLEDWKGTRADALRLNQFFGAFLASFGVFLLIAAGLVILSAVSARVLARYREMGILKAVGFTPRALVALVLGENLAIAVVGAVAGVVAGALLAPTLQLRFSQVLERGSATFPVTVLVGAVAVVLVIVVAATLLPAVRAGRVPASRAIARGAAPVSTRPVARRRGRGPPSAGRARRRGDQGRRGPAAARLADGGRTRRHGDRLRRGTRHGPLLRPHRRRSRAGRHASGHHDRPWPGWGRGSRRGSLGPARREDLVHRDRAPGRRGLRHLPAPGAGRRPRRYRVRRARGPHDRGTGRGGGRVLARAQARAARRRPAAPEDRWEAAAAADRGTLRGGRGHR